MDPNTEVDVRLTLEEVATLRRAHGEVVGEAEHVAWESAQGKLSSAVNDLIELRTTEIRRMLVAQGLSR